MNPNMHHNHFLIWCLVCTYTHNSKTRGCMWIFCILNVTALLLHMSISCVRARYEIQMGTYGSKHIAVPFRYAVHLCIHVHVLRHIIWKLQVIYGRSVYQVIVILSEAFFVWFRFAWEIWLESYGSTQASVILWCNIVWVYCKPAHKSLHGVQLHVCLCMKQNSHTLWLHYTHQTTALPLMMHRFIRRKLTCYTTCSSVVQLIVYANIQITKRYSTTVDTSWRVCC